MGWGVVEGVKGIGQLFESQFNKSKKSILYPWPI